MMERNSVTATVHLTEEAQRKALQEIAIFYSDIRGEEVGVIACQQTLDFFLEILGKQVYNQALDDAHQWYQKVSENVDSEFYTLYKEPLK